MALIQAPVKINVKNLHFAKITIGENGTLTFGAPDTIVGSMEITRKPTVAKAPLYGDGAIRHQITKKTGFELTLQLNKIPPDIRSYMEGTTIVNGVEVGKSSDQSKPFALGWEVEKTNGKQELIWFLYCLADPLEEKVQQTDDNINYSTDSMSIIAMEHVTLGRFYTLIDTDRTTVTTDMVSNFFTKVQTGDEITAAE